MTWKVYVRTKTRAADHSIVEPLHYVADLSHIDTGGLSSGVFGIIDTKGNRYLWNWSDVLDVSVVQAEEPKPEEPTP